MIPRYQQENSNRPIEISVFCSIRQGPVTDGRIAAVDVSAAAKVDSRCAKPSSVAAQSPGRNCAEVEITHLPARCQTGRGRCSRPYTETMPKV